MSNRVSSAKRVELQNVAEREVMRYSGDHSVWHRHIHNVTLDPVQILKMEEMDRHDYTIDFSSRRTGKTAVKELHELEDLATKPDQELGIIAPRQAQSEVNLDYHMDAIRRSEILTNYLMVKNGRPQIADTSYQFMNRSKAQAYGIMANVDGGDLTHADLEEVDDMPKDRLFSRFLLMLAGKRRLGASEESQNNPHVRITGVFKGADTLTELLRSGQYHAIGCFHGDRARAEIRKFIATGYMEPDQVNVDTYEFPLPIANVVNAMALDMVDALFIEKMRGQLSEDEFTRQLLCVNTASRNLIWEKFIRRAIQMGLDARIDQAQPMPGEHYKPRGLVSMGYDHSGHGEQPESSKYAVVFTEQISNFTCVIFCKTWAPGTDEEVVARDLVSLWRYFQPVEAFGDAFGIGLITRVNDLLFAEGLTTINRHTVGDGDSTASTWPDWAFSPIRFAGELKHQMAQALRAVFHNRLAVIPYIDDQDPSDPDTADLRLLVRQLGNIRAEQNKATYSSYSMVRKKVGDDLFDAAMASVWGLFTRGVGIISSTVLTSSRDRSSLLQPHTPVS